jgi:hypothetical protein
MKLLFCDRCYDLFKLDFELRSCKCGLVKGQYINNSEAVVNGKGVSLAIGNGSLLRAVYGWLSAGNDHDRDHYLNKNKVEFCWVRPHSGEGNPHTTINPQLGETE